MARKKIREYDSKRLLKQHLKRVAGIDLQINSAQVTESTDIAELANTETWLSSTRLVVKPDMLFGKRGKSGLVALNLDMAQVAEFVKQRLGKEVEMGGCKAPITTFIVEPFMPHDQEFYLSIVSERLGSTLSFSECGGIEIEENWDKVKTIFLPTEKSLTNEACAPLIATLPLEVRDKIGDFIKGVFTVFQDLDFSFLEMNPFTLVNGEPYPLDMRGELDDTAAFKNFNKWGNVEFPLPFGRVLSPTETFIHSLDEKTSASLNKVACAPFGGPIAVIRDDSKIVQLGGESAQRKLRIFSSSGHLLGETIWKHPGGRLIGMAWTDDQTLVCLVQDGTVFRYTIHAELLEPSISMGQECFERNVVDCVFWGNGLVCITETNQLFCISDFKNPNPVKLADPEIEDPPLCMAVIEPQYTMSGNVEVLLGIGDACVLAVEEDGVQQLGLEVLRGPIQKMAVSRDGQWLASFTHDGRLLVMTSNLNEILIEQECESALPPEQLAWCGMDTVLLYWDDILLMMGPRGDPVRYFYDEPIILLPECDGVRILSNSSMEFLQRVPDSTESIFKIGSTSPAALLYDALDHFDRQSAKADENLRLIRPSLPEAVEACIDAAGHEFDVLRQRTLLRAASYGQAFCSNFQRDHIQEMCKTLRVLNAVRHPDVGMPLSIQQYKLLTPSVLIGRLINSYKHFLALRISEYLGMNQEMVIMHWACSKISASLAISDATLLEILLDKLKLCKGISYAAVAAHADKNGRRKLAAMLVEHEPRSSKQVPLLLSIGEEDTALMKAIESGDTDLVYLVLFHIWRKRQPLEFFGMIQARALARDLFIIYARCYKHEFLKDFFLSTGQLQEVAFLLWKESWELGKNPMASRGSPLHGPRIKIIEKAQNLFLETKEYTFEAKAAEEHAKLLRMQHDLEVSTKQAIFVDSSISDTIRTCIVLGNHRAAMKVKTEFKVSEKRWYWLKVFALATIRDWDALEKFSKEKRPPIGYRPFVEACVEADEKGEALKYIPKLTDPRERAESYARIGMAKEAADAASQAKDGELLGRLKLTFSQNAAASSIFDTLRDRLSFQGVS